jgi:RNA recognition motif-containing protein
MEIYVGNLPYRISEDELRNVFSEYGEVGNVKIINDRDTGRSKGFAFVQMENDAEANAAIQALDGSEMGGRSARVNQAKPREERAPRY